MRRLYLLSFLLVATTVLKAQVSAYTFSQSSGSYVAITGGTLLGTTTSDDEYYVNPAVVTGGTTKTGVGFPIGFNFTYNGNVYDRVGVNNNGWMSLGKSSLSPAVDMNTTSAYTPLSSTTANTPDYLRSRIVALGRDLQGQTGSEIRLQLIGVAPSRQFVVQFTKYKRYTSGTGDSFDFQIILNETSNTIQIVYGTFIFGTAATSSQVAQIGLGGTSATDFNNRQTIAPHDFNTSTAGTSNTSAAQLPYTGVAVNPPASGLTFLWTPPLPCAGTPAPGNTIASLPAITCIGLPADTLTLQNNPSSSGLTYQWMASLDNISYVSIPWGNSFSLVDTPNVSTWYKCVVTCTNSGLSATSNPVQVSVPVMTYASLPFTESFDNWTDGCNTTDIPGTVWRNVPSTGNNSWRRDDLGSSAGWSSTSGGYIPSYNEGTNSARFHSYNTSGKGYLDLYINLSTSAGPCELSFDYINTSGSDVFKVFLSTNGGLTFTQIGSTYGVQGTWAPKLIPFNATSNKAIIRLEATGDNGSTDIGIDRLNVKAVLCAAPGGLTATNITGTSATFKWSPVAGAASGYEWENSTTNINPAGNGAATADTFANLSTLNGSTTYYTFIRSNCGVVNGYSNWSSASFTTLRTNDLCADAIPLTIRANAGDTATYAVAVVAGFEGSSIAPTCTSPTSATGKVNDVWYKFVAPVGTDSLILATKPGSSTDWVMAIYTACTDGTQVACSDDAGASIYPSSTLMPYIGTCSLVGGGTYYVRIHPYGTSTTATCFLYAYKGGACPAPPANDLCINAVTISNDCNTPTAGTTVNASAQALAQPSCDLFGSINDVWYKFNAGTRVNADVFIKDIQAGATIKATVYKGNCGLNIPMSYCASNGTSAVPLNMKFRGLEQNQDYFIRVWSNSPSLAGTFNICLSDSTPISIVDTAGSGGCIFGATVNISATNLNNNKWVPIMNGDRIIAAINANNNDLGDVITSVYRNNAGLLRQDAAGIFYMDRNITISPATQPVTPVNVRLYFMASDLDSLVNRAAANVTGRGSLKVTKSAAVCGPAFSSNGAAVNIYNQTGNGPYNAEHYIELQIPSFSTFYMHAGSVALPVTITSLTGQRVGSKISLHWTTATEINNKGFEIERSADGLRFIKVMYLATNAPGGNSTASISYDADDIAPMSGVNYYRIKQIDKDGKATYSNAVAVRGLPVSLLTLGTLYPNPAKEKITAYFQSPVAVDITVIISDMTGKVIRKQAAGLSVGDNNVALDVNTLPPGSYMIKAICKDGCETAFRKFTKQ